MKITLVIIAAILCTTTVRANGCHGMNGRKVYLIADNGLRLARCSGCGAQAFLSIGDSAGVHGKAGDAFAMWTLKDVGADKCALKGDNRKYLARCAGCWQHPLYNDAVFVHVPNTDGPWSQWKMEKHGKKYSFKADSGKYMARCNGCVLGGAVPNFAFVHSTVPIGNALWKVQFV